MVLQLMRRAPGRFRYGVQLAGRRSIRGTRSRTRGREMALVAAPPGSHRRARPSPSTLGRSPRDFGG